jgi:hypothetical protein
MPSAASVAATVAALAADREGGTVQARVGWSHHGNVDITPASRFDVLSGARFALLLAGIAIEKQRAFHEAGSAAIAASYARSALTTAKTASAPVTASAAVEAANAFVSA